MINLDKKEVIERAFIINYKVDDFDDKSFIDLFILGLADIQDKFGETALIWASDWDDMEIVDLLIKNGANVNIQDKLGRTALMQASRNDNEKIVKLLIQYGANLNLQDTRGKTVLDYANTEIKRLLKQAGAK